MIYPARTEYRFLCILFVSLVFFQPLTLLGQTSSPDYGKDYEKLLECRYSCSPVPVPDGGISWSRDTATWTLESGELWFMEPLSDGTVTGMIFEGKGFFSLTIPNQLEVKQLRRFTGDEDLEAFHEPFKRLILRTSGPMLSSFVTLPHTEDFKENKLAAKQLVKWLRDSFFDSNVRLIGAILNPGDEYFLTDIETKNHGWVRFEHDGQRLEEIHLMKLQKTNKFLEIWVSLDQAAHRLSNGRPGVDRHEFWDIVHADITIDLMKKSDKPRQGWSRIKPREAIFKTVLTVKSLAPDLGALFLYLHPLAEVTSVTDDQGEPLTFIRNHIGDRYSSVRKEIYESSLLIVLPDHLETMEERKITIEYERDILNYASGRFWYPTIKYNIDDKHRAKLTVIVPANFEFRAVGKLMEEQVDENRKTCIWEINQPVKAVGFSFGKNYEEKRIPLNDGSMVVVSFGRELRITSGNIVEKVGQDVARSLEFFQDRFSAKLPFETLYASSIASVHGQAFHGFLHLSEYTYLSEHPGASELFRSHEVAHQFWGLEVGFDSYRDQWLSESLAEYSAMMFVQATMPEQKYFEEIVGVYLAELIGSLKGAMSKFARPWNIKFHPAERKKIGPIGVGFRASPAEVPQAYFIQSYHKGALVIHMIRNILQQDSGDDTLFFSILSEFLRNFRGKSATTDDFRKTIEAKTNQDWDWFFEQWIEGTCLPSYTWRYTVEGNQGPDMLFTIHLHVEQTDVPDNFRMPVPIQVQSKTGQIEDFVITIDSPRKTFVLQVQDEPKKIIFNTNNAVLAKIISK